MIKLHGGVNNETLTPKKRVFEEYEVTIIVISIAPKPLGT